MSDPGQLLEEVMFVADVLLYCVANVIDRVDHSVAKQWVTSCISPAGGWLPPDERRGN
jgi:hypothetical protein